MKVAKTEAKNNDSQLYDYYIAIDWSQINVAIAWMNARSKEPKYIERNNDLKIVKEKIKELRGNKILTIEETTTTHWLYVELKEYVNRILICDPYRNALLSEGPKNDRIDARKLCKLLRSEMLKEVYHSVDEDYKVRKLVSSYEDVVKAGVRVLNQRNAFYRAEGLSVRYDELPDKSLEKFIDNNYKKAIELYNEQRKDYETEFRKLKKSNKVINYLCGISGIAEINACKIYSRVIDGARFANKYKYWAFVGLAKHDKESGGRSYGKKSPRYSRTLKSVYKQAVNAAIGGKNDIREYYEHLITEKRLPEKLIKRQVARYIAKVSYAVMKNKTAYIPYQWRKDKEEK